MIYYNMKTSQGVETVDELSAKDFKSYKEFRAEKLRLRDEYRLAGMAVYFSQRSTKEWNN